MVSAEQHLVVSVQIQGNPRCGGECSLQVLSAEGKAGSASGHTKELILVILLQVESYTGMT
jgi:hypothetical protein